MRNCNLNAKPTLTVQINVETIDYNSHFAVPLFEADHLIDFKASSCNTKSLPINKLSSLNKIDYTNRQYSIKH